MPIVTFTEDLVDDIVATDFLGTGAKAHVERAAVEAGPFSEIGTVTLVAGTRLYELRDLAGATSSWYRIFYSKSDNTSPSTPGDPFQAGDETGGLLCSWQDVQQDLAETLTANAKEAILEKIRQVTTAVEGYTGRWFVPRPLSGTTTYRFHTGYGRKLHIPKGIRSITTLGVASSDQPESGGTYTTVTDAFLDPPAWERDDWPALYVCLPRTGSFYDATFGVEITGEFGWARVPYDIQGVAIRAVIRRHLGKAGTGAVAIGPEGQEFLLPDMSGADRLVLDRYRQILI